MRLGICWRTRLHRRPAADKSPLLSLAAASSLFVFLPKRVSLLGAAPLTPSAHQSSLTLRLLPRGVIAQSQTAAACQHARTHSYADPSRDLVAEEPLNH